MSAIDPLPPWPDPTDPVDTFNSKAFAVGAAMPGFIDQTNSARQDVLDSATAADASADASAASATAAHTSELAAAGSANAAAGAAGAIAWVSGTTYAVGDRRWSLLNQQLYRRTTGGGGTTDPKLDGANWARVYAEPELVTAESLFMAACF